MSGVEPVEPSAATLVARLGYRGTEFHGFAEQPTQRTVAGELRRAFETILRRPCELTCAGRTDAGVHALSQYVSLPVFADELDIPSRRLLKSLSALTPDDLSVSELFWAAPGFSARFDAQARTYRYRIAAGQTRPILSWPHAWWFKGELDAEVMHEAAQLLVGEHDFKTFCKADSAEGKTTCRNISRLQVSHVEEAGEKLIVVDITGNAFLHNMVRIIVGTLVEVGRHHRPVSWVGEALTACNRTAAGPSAPAHGLTFVDVSYPAGALVSWDRVPASEV